MSATNLISKTVPPDSPMQMRARGDVVSGLWAVLKITVGIGGLLILTACAQPRLLSGDYSRLNSRFREAEPALSGNGQFVAMISNRGGVQALALYDLQRQEFINLPHLNRRNTIIESPSLSRSARYMVYVVRDRGRPQIVLYDRLRQRRQTLATGFQGTVRNPSISPDGRYVAFESGRRGQWDIEVLDRGPGIELDLVGAAAGGVVNGGE